MKRVGVVLACVFMLCLSGCGVDTTPEGLLSDLARREASKPSGMSVDLEIYGSDSDGKYAEVIMSMTAERNRDVLCFRDVDLRLSADGSIYDMEMEIWSDGETAYSYIAEAETEGSWYRYPAGETRAAGIDPVTLAGLLGNLADAGLSGIDSIATEDLDDAIVLSFDLDAEFVSDLLNTCDEGLTGETSTWEGGHAELVFVASTGRLSTVSIQAEGSTESMSLEYTLDLSIQDPVSGLAIPDDILVADGK